MADVGMTVTTRAEMSAATTSTVDTTASQEEDDDEYERGESDLEKVREYSSLSSLSTQHAVREVMLDASNITQVCPAARTKVNCIHSSPSSPTHASLETRSLTRATSLPCPQLIQTTPRRRK